MDTASLLTVGSFPLTVEFFTYSRLCELFCLQFELIYLQLELFYIQLKIFSLQCESASNKQLNRLSEKKLNCK